MKKAIHPLLLSVIFACAISCIGEDIIDDQVDPVLRINNPLESLAIGETHQFEATYLNNIGQEENVDLIWSSSDEAIISIDAMGLASALEEGEAIITVSTLDNSITSVANSTLQITDETIVDNQSRTGTIITTSSYTLTGEFVLENIPNEDIIRLSISDNYAASSSLPGLYVYFTNNPNTINGAYEIGPVTVFNGAHTFDISNQDVQLNQYSYLLYWCKPFSVKVGEGKIN
ncbi:hypothetical protein [Aquimarina sp. 2201CG5-10]|uniref:Ig-like domain-containing protein n=1 Tax=Aquimarina callyspongiae TaxID=3098150 RepID=UPI002AB3C63F|nr:hypothetical protein [Aquimarina sp. 2201CG5-10]MDY8136568.1 hypothetical protein [Aquimarina sp. 2201CG5-10]